MCLVSCAGYQLGGVKPASLASVKYIAVPMFANATQHPRAEALATSAVANAFVQDGTYRIARRDQADAVLEGKLARIKYSTIRGTRLDTLLPGGTRQHRDPRAGRSATPKIPPKSSPPARPRAPASFSSPPTSRPPATTPCPKPSNAPAKPWSRASPTAIDSDGHAAIFRCSLLAAIP